MSGCSNNGGSTEEPQPTASPGSIRYIDRNVYFPQGVGITPSIAAAQEKIKEFISVLESNTDLGPGYFIFGVQEDSLLQPPTSDKAFEGRTWNSFIRVWPDAALNEFITTNLGAPTDANVVVALNKKNPKQFYILFRQSCFFSEATCKFASTEESRALVFRAFGYAIGITDELASQTSVMQPQVEKSQALESEVKKFYGIFDNRLEDVRTNPSVFAPEAAASSAPPAP